MAVGLAIRKLQHFESRFYQHLRFQCLFTNIYMQVKGLNKQVTDVLNSGAN